MGQASVNEELDPGTQKNYELLERCEEDDVQKVLSEWERGFLNSNLERKERGWPIKSEKVTAVLERIIAKAENRGSSKTYRRSYSR